MEQILLHILGDYLFQNDWMALGKVKRFKPAAVHALVYSLGFLLLHPSAAAWCVILGTHFLIDRFRLASYWIQFVNGQANRDNCGYGPEKPAFMAVWLMIIIDNGFHLIINYAALRWL